MQGSGSLFLCNCLVLLSIWSISCLYSPSARKKRVWRILVFFFFSLKTNLKILQKPAEVKISFNVLFENNFCWKSRIHLPFTLQEKGTKLQAIRPLWEHHSRCRKKKSIFFSLVSVHRSARKRNKKASCEMEIIPATDIPWSTRELSRWLPLAAHFQLLGAPYSWDYADKAA